MGRPVKSHIAHQKFEVCRFFESNKQGVFARKDIEDALLMAKFAVDRAIKSLANENLIERVSRGKYKYAIKK